MPTLPTLQPLTVGALLYSCNPVVPVYINRKIRSTRARRRLAITFLMATVEIVLVGISLYVVNELKPNTDWKIVFCTLFGVSLVNAMYCGLYALQCTREL